MRSGAEQAAREELDRMAGELPPELRPAVERLLLRTVHRLVHKPTLELRAAAESGDGELVRVLAGLFGDAGTPAGLSRKEASGTAPSQQTG
jgi:glutamyl-tRNA reductase